MARRAGAALPGERWCSIAAADAAATIDIAMVANPPPGSLQGLPRLRLIQSLWAGVDRLLADPTVPDRRAARRAWSIRR